jgi:hypothetical protein
MQALEVEVDITTDGQLVNARLPSSCSQWYGNHTKLILILPDRQDAEISRQARIDKWRGLLKETQALPQAQILTEEEIAAEVETYRISI